MSDLSLECDYEVVISVQRKQGGHRVRGKKTYRKYEEVVGSLEFLELKG